MSIKLLLVTSLDLFKRGSWGSWTEVSDRVRGGVSFSTFDQGVFSGRVDSSILNAGFAGQESPITISNNSVGQSIQILFGDSIGSVDKPLVRSEWKGIEIEARGDGKMYSLRLLDKSALSGSAFKFSHAGEVKRVVWSDFVESVRGRETGVRLGDREGDFDRIEKIGLMCQSYFGKQNGEFELVVVRIGLWK